MNKHTDCFISVDIETSGPVPDLFSLLSIGACLVHDDKETFACLLKPTSDGADPKALEISKFSLKDLQKKGLKPEEGMALFADWIRKVSKERSPVFVGLNAGFDWSFINYYFHRYFGSNPFGYACLDIKSLFLGATDISWPDCKSSIMKKTLHPQLIANHDALQDAKAQAELFRLTLDYRSKLPSSAARPH